MVSFSACVMAASRAFARSPGDREVFIQGGGSAAAAGTARTVAVRTAAVNVRSKGHSRWGTGRCADRGIDGRGWRRLQHCFVHGTKEGPGGYGTWRLHCIEKPVTARSLPVSSALPRVVARPTTKGGACRPEVT